MVKLNLGCGDKIMKDYINLDWKDYTGKTDIIHDLNEYPYPFQNNTVDEIKLWHVLEHLNDPERCLRELYRILKKSGKIHIKVPFFASVGGLTPLEHKNFFSISLTFNPFLINPLISTIHKRDEYYKYKFKLISYRYNMFKRKSFVKNVFGRLYSMLINAIPTKFYESRLAFILPIEEIELWLEKV